MTEELVKYKLEDVIFTEEPFLCYSGIGGFGMLVVSQILKDKIFVKCSCGESECFSPDEVTRGSDLFQKALRTKRV